MSLLGEALEPEKETEVSFGDSSIWVKKLRYSDMAVWLEGEVPPPSQNDDDEVRADLEAERLKKRAVKIKEYVARFCVTRWNDPDLTFSVDTAVELLTDDRFDSVAEKLYSAAVQDDNFRMGRDEAIKKFAALLSPTP